MRSRRVTSWLSRPGWVTRTRALVEISPWSAAYPRGQEGYDLRTGEEGERPEVLENIQGVPLPEADPLHGRQGPLVEIWSG